MRLNKVKSFRLLMVLAAMLIITGCGWTSTPVPGSPPPQPPPSHPSPVVVSPATATVFRGQTQQFTATVSGQADQTVIWSLDGYSGSIDSTGLYTAPSNFDGQTASVIATSKAAPSASGTALVTLPTTTLFDHTWRGGHRPRGESSVQCNGRRAEKYPGELDGTGRRND